MSNTDIALIIYSIGVMVISSIVARESRCLDVRLARYSKYRPNSHVEASNADHITSGLYIGFWWPVVVCVIAILFLVDVFAKFIFRHNK